MKGNGNIKRLISLDDSIGFTNFSNGDIGVKYIKSLNGSIKVEYFENGTVNLEVVEKPKTTKKK